MSLSHTNHLRRWLLSLPPLEYLLQSLRATLIGALRQGPIPQHVAFVMDGNRRYARKNHVETVEGHHLGFEALAKILEVCYKTGVRVVTIYAFSIENFKRSRYEVDALMDMAKTKLVQMSEHGELLQRYGASVRVLGDRSLVRQDVLDEVDRAVEMTRGNDAAVLNVCFPYTGREEITHAVRETVREWSVPPAKGRRGGGHRKTFSETHIQRNILRRQLSIVPEENGMGHQQEEEYDDDDDEDEDEQGDEDDHEPSLHPDPRSEGTTSASDSDQDTLSALRAPSSATSTSPTPTLLPAPKLPDPESISPLTLTHHTYFPTSPPLDLLIRTSGVARLSDFMLWQCHETTQLKFLDCLWPEFDLWKFLPVLVEWQWGEMGRMRTGEGRAGR